MLVIILWFIFGDPLASAPILLILLTTVLCYSVVVVSKKKQGLPVRVMAPVSPTPAAPRGLKPLSQLSELPRHEPSSSPLEASAHAAVPLNKVCALQKKKLLQVA